MPAFLYNAILKADQALSRLQTALHERSGGLVIIFLHGLFRDRAEVESGAAYPQQETTVDDFAELIRYFQEAGYQFITPDQMEQGEVGKKHAMVTFDDGYFNNKRALPVLEKFNVPATVFVSARHVLEGKAYWWEALYHARRKQKVDERAMYQEMNELNLLTSEEIERRLRNEFGPDFFVPRGETDRPMTERELREFSAHRLISIGNHTFDHNVLTAYAKEEVRMAIRKAQDALGEIMGKAPVSIAYPNGEFNAEIARIAREEGLQFGFTTFPRKEYFPGILAEERRMVLGRFCPSPREDLRKQYRYFRSDLMLTSRLRSWRARGWGAQM